MADTASEDREVEVAMMERESHHDIPAELEQGSAEASRPPAGDAARGEGGMETEAVVPETTGGHQSREGTGILSPRRGKLLQWMHLNYSVVGRKGDEIEILKDNYGSVPGGQIAALMGPSGAGKSSLLNVLAGRVTPSAKSRIGGLVKLDGEEIDPVANRANVAYVMQDDALLPTTTPREALTFSAAMRLDPHMSKEERATLVDGLLEDLGLDVCADTYIGGALFTGISGGQRKRTSVGVDLITSPSMLFLDEPTSGLDSYSAKSVVELLKRVAAAGATVACTIHQPSSEIFSLFDVVILLRKGRVVFDGSVDGLVNHFAERGYPCPPTYNPSDHVFFVLATIDSEEEMAKKDLYAPMPEQLEGRPQQNFRNSSRTMRTQGQNPISRFFYEASWIGDRDFKYTMRNKEALISRFGAAVFLNLLFGLVFLGAGGNDDTIEQNFQTHLGAVSFTTISLMFDSAIPVALEFPTQRPVFLREYAVGTYGSLAYFWSRLPLELVIAFLQTLVSTILVYWSMELRGNFILFVLSWWALNVAAASFAVVLGCSVDDVKSVTEFLPPMFVPQLLFSGFFVRIEDIPIYLRWAQYLCSLKYTLNLVYLVEFTDECTEEERERCIEIRELNNVDRDLWWTNVLALAGLILFFRCIGLYILTQKAKSVY